MAEHILDILLGVFNDGFVYGELGRGYNDQESTNKAYKEVEAVLKRDYIPIDQIKAKREEIDEIVWQCHKKDQPAYAVDQIIALFEEKQVRRCPLCDEDYTPALQYEVCPHHKLTSLTEGGK